MLPTSHTVVCMPTTALTGSGPASGYNHIIVSLPFNIPLAHTRARPNIHTHMRAQIHAKYMHTGTNTHAYPRTHTHTHTHRNLLAYFSNSFQAGLLGRVLPT